MKDPVPNPIQTMSGASSWEQRYTSALWNLLVGYPINYVHQRQTKQKLEETPEELANDVRQVAAEAVSKQSAAYAVADAVADFGRASAEMLGVRRDIPATALMTFNRSLLNALKGTTEADGASLLSLVVTSLVKTVHQAVNDPNGTPNNIETLLQLYANSVVAVANILIRLAKQQTEQQPSSSTEAAPPAPHSTAEMEGVEAVGSILSSVNNWWREIRYKLPYFERLRLCDTCYDDSLVRFYNIAPKFTESDLELLPGLDGTAKQAPLSFELHRSNPCSDGMIQQVEGVAEAGVYYRTKDVCVVKPLGHLYQYTVPLDQRKYVQVYANAVVCLCLNLCFKQCDSACPLNVAALVNVKYSCDSATPYRLTVAGMHQTVDIYFSFQKGNAAIKDRCGNPRSAYLAAISKIRVYVPFSRM